MEDGVADQQGRRCGGGGVEAVSQRRPAVVVQRGPKAVDEALHRVEPVDELQREVVPERPKALLVELARGLGDVAHWVDHRGGVEPDLQQDVHEVGGVSKVDVGHRQCESKPKREGGQQHDEDGRHRQPQRGGHLRPVAGLRPAAVELSHQRDDRWHGRLGRQRQPDQEGVLPSRGVGRGHCAVVVRELRLRARRAGRCFDDLWRLCAAVAAGSGRLRRAADRLRAWAWTRTVGGQRLLSRHHPLHEHLAADLVLRHPGGLPNELRHRGRAQARPEGLSAVRAPLPAGVHLPAQPDGALRQLLSGHAVRQPLAGAGRQPLRRRRRSGVPADRLRRLPSVRGPAGGGAVSSESAVVVDDVSKRFRLYSERNQSLKAALMRHGRARYEEFWAVREVSLEIKQGATYGLVGENGSGKSTLLKCIAKILRPDRGTIRTTGKLAALLELGSGFHPELSGRENVFLNGSILGLSKRELTSRFDEIVGFAGLEQFIDQPVKNYSSGMYVRLGFSVAINVDPDVLLVDEVLAVGDAVFQRRCQEKFSEFRRAGKTVVVVSHAMETVRTMCDEVAWLTTTTVLPARRNSLNFS